MGRVLLERLKTCLVAILVLSGFLQIGILWKQQGFPSFLPLLVGNNTGNSIEMKDVFAPYRVILSSGDGSYWQISQNDKLYNELWMDAKNNLKTVLTGKPQEILPSSDWGNKSEKLGPSLIDGRSYTIQFTTEIPVYLAETLFDIKTISQNAPPKFSKIMVVPGSNMDDSDENVVYIYTKNDGIYQYTVRANEKGFNLDMYNSILEQISNDDGKKYRELTTTRYIDKSKSQFDSEPDVLIVSSPPYEYEYRQIDLSTPDGLTRSNDTFRMLLGNEFSSYNISEGVDSAYIIAKNLENQYKIYSNGILEYRYLLGHDDSDKVGAAKSCENSLKFINKCNGLLWNSHARIFLKNLVDKGSFYEFTFDYMIDNLPVYIEIDPGKSMKTLANAIVIEADSKRVLSCRWQLLDIKNGNLTKDFDCRLDTVAYSSKQSPLKDVQIYDMRSGYLVTRQVKEKISLWPSWVVEKTNGGYLGLSLVEVK